MDMEYMRRIDILLQRKYMLCTPLRFFGVSKPIILSMWNFKKKCFFSEAHGSQTAMAEQKNKKGPFRIIRLIKIQWIKKTGFPNANESHKGILQGL